jgi:dTDP-4-dehydrorhamnose 3,5-epimerase-like enzyme
MGRPGTRTLAHLAKPIPRPDLRGQVMETYRESWFPWIPPVKQLVQSDSQPRVLRGMHLHRKQWDIWRFVKGRAWVRLYDTETDEQQFINADENIVIAIPPGISHGFYTVTGCTLVYALTQEYDGSDEFGWRPFDGLGNVANKDWPGPTLYGGWPTSPYGIIVSDRDLSAPRLRDFTG